MRLPHDGKMQLFEMRRGVREVGNPPPVVAHGVIFESGKCVMAWRGEHQSIAVYDSVEQIAAIHIHDNATELKLVFSYDGQKVSSALVSEYQDTCEGIGIDFQEGNAKYIWDERKKLCDMFQGQDLP